MWFYTDEFDCAQWLLYVMNTVTSGHGRGLVEGRLYTEAGILIAATKQEGVVRPASAQTKLTSGSHNDEVARAKL